MVKKIKQVYLGIDIGGTKIAHALFDRKKLITHTQNVGTPSGRSILNVVSGFYKKYSKRYELCGIGISTAGMVSDSGEIVGSTGNIKNWYGTEVKKILEKRHNVPVVVENDANAAAYAEYKIGLAKGSTPLLMVTLGTGVGGGIVINGKVLRGKHFAGGEIGHIKLSYSKHRLCTCSKYDCLEAYASGNGLIALAKHYFPDKKNMHSTKALFSVAESEKHKDNLLALRAVEDWHFYVAEGICNLVQVIDPEKVVLSGGLSLKVNLKLLNKELKKMLLPAMEKSVDKGLVVKSKFGNDAGILGACLLVSNLLI